MLHTHEHTHFAPHAYDLAAPLRDSRGNQHQTKLSGHSSFSRGYPSLVSHRSARRGCSEGLGSGASLPLLWPPPDAGRLRGRCGALPPRDPRLARRRFPPLRACRRFPPRTSSAAKGGLPLRAPRLAAEPVIHPAPVFTEVRSRRGGRRMREYGCVGAQWLSSRRCRVRVPPRCPPGPSPGGLGQSCRVVV